MTQTVSSSLRRTILLFVGVLLYACVLQGARPLYSPDEGRYTDVALAMLDDGDWVHPMLHHEVEHWSKPPLTYWGIAASLVIFGHHEFSTRLPGALAFAFTILLLMRLGRRFVPAQPWLPALIYASFLLPSLAANLVTTDALLALWETLQVVAFVELWWATTPSAVRHARWLLGAAAGLAFMTKGPPGLLAVAACLVFAFWSSGWQGLRRTFGWDSLAIFLITGGTWYAWVVLQEPGVLHYFLVEEVVNRVASDKMRRNAQWYGAFKVYVPTLLIGSLPWLPVFCRALWKHRRDGLQRIRASEDLRLLACWVLLPLAVFVLARSRLPLYLLPLFAPLALLAAREIVPLPVRSVWWKVLIGLWLVLLLLARAAPLWFDNADDDKRLADLIRQQIAPTPDEVAFVESAPRYGLRFYLGSEIERLELPDKPVKPQSQDLVSELREQEGCRLLVIEQERSAELQRALQDRAVDFRRLEDTGGYSLFAQLSSDCAWTR